MSLVLGGEDFIKTVEGCLSEAEESVCFATHLTTWLAREMTHKMHLQLGF